MSDGGAQFWSLFLGSSYSFFKINFYAAGTTTDKAVWTDEGKTTPVFQVQADANGFLKCYADGDYNLNIVTSEDATLYDFTNVKITSDTATMWEGNHGISYPAATLQNIWQLFAKHDLSNNLQTFAINDGDSWEKVVEKDANGRYVFDDILMKKPIVDARAFLPYNYAEDGTGEYLTEFQAAVDYAETLGSRGIAGGGGLVLLPPGKFLINGQLTLYGGFDGKERTSLKGAGSGSTTLKLADSANTDMIGFNSTSGFNHLTLGNLRLDGNRANQTSTTLRGVYVLRAYSGFVMHDMKIDDIAGTAIDCEEISNAPYFENIGITRADKYGLYIHEGNNDGILVNNMEIGPCGTAHLMIDNISGAGLGGFVFNNFRCDNGGATGTWTSDLIRLERLAISIVFNQPFFRMNSDLASVYNIIRLENASAPYLQINGYSASAAPVAVTMNLINDIDNSKIHLATYQEPLVRWNCPAQQIETAADNPTQKMFNMGETYPRFEISPRGPAWGAGSADTTVQIRYQTADTLTISDKLGNVYNLRLKDLTVVEKQRFSEMTAPGNAPADNVYLYAQDNGAGKTELMASFGTGAAQVVAIEP